MVSEVLAPVERDEFRSIVKQLNGNDVSLRKLIISPERFHVLVKLLPIAQFGHCDMLPDEQLPGLDCVADYCEIIPSNHRLRNHLVNV